MSKNDIKPGEQLTMAQINRIRKQNQTATTKAGNGGAQTRAKMTVAEIKDVLADKGVEIPEGAKKDDLQALLDEADQGGE